MKLRNLNSLLLAILTFGNSFAQRSTPYGNTIVDRWKKAIVKLESIQQRYTFSQVDVLLQKQIDTIKALSQHDKYNRQAELLTLKDTIRGTALLVSDGAKIYLITARHLIKATENEGNNLESINDLISIQVKLGNKASNDISLMNLSTNVIDRRPFVFSSDQIDIGIISFQKSSYKPILAYLKQNGCEPMPIQFIDEMADAVIGDQIFTIGFPALPGTDYTSPVVSEGKISKFNKPTSFFMGNIAVYPGNSGGPVIKGNKLIGIVSFQQGISTNLDAAMHPFDKATSASIIKATYILPLLRKLQENEKKPFFGK